MTRQSQLKEEDKEESKVNEEKPCKAELERNDKIRAKAAKDTEK